jgi:5-methylcytosine-specific restriction endonuclease McrA
MSKQTRKKFRKQHKRSRLFKRDGGRCFWCKKALALIKMGTDVTKIPEDLRATFDHLLPRSKGGTDEDKNLVTCCPKCNNRRGNGLVNPATRELMSPTGVQWILSNKEV